MFAPTSGHYCELVRQPLLAADGKFRVRLRSSRSWLSPAHGDAVRAGGDESISVVVDTAQVASLQFEAYMPGFAPSEVNAAERAQRMDRVGGRFRETQVQLHHFIAVPLACVLYVGINVERVTSVDSRGRQLQITVLELRIAQPITEGI